MKKTFLLLTVVALVLPSCSTLYPGPSRALNPPPHTLKPQPATPPEPRTIVLNGEEFTEEECGGFISWECKDFVYEGPTLVEVGYFGSPDFEGMGFVLYDGGDSGAPTFYLRSGLERWWTWGIDEDYLFIIKADGTGLYYDFTLAAPDEEVTPEVFKCYRR